MGLGLVVVVCVSSVGVADGNGVVGVVGIGVVVVGG